MMQMGRSLKEFDMQTQKNSPSPQTAITTTSHRERRTNFAAKSAAITSCPS